MQRPRDAWAIRVLSVQGLRPTIPPSPAASGRGAVRRLAPRHWSSWRRKLRHSWIQTVAFQKKAGIWTDRLVNCKMTIELQCGTQHRAVRHGKAKSSVQGRKTTGENVLSGSGPSYFVSSHLSTLLQPILDGHTRDTCVLLESTTSPSHLTAPAYLYQTLSFHLCTKMLTQE